MEIFEENATRKLDDLGRIVIPKAVRLRFHLIPGDAMEYFTFRHDGRWYIALANESMKDTRFLQAAEVLDELGIEIPDELLDKISEN